MKHIATSFKDHAHLDSRNLKSADKWSESDHTKSYPRSYTHLTHALAQIFEKVYIPATIARIEQLSGNTLTSEERADMHHLQAEKHSFNYYSDSRWSPMFIELKAQDYKACQVDYIEADETCKQIIVDFFDDLEMCLVGIPGVKSDILNHTITVEGPGAFLRMIIALCQHNKQISPSEIYYESFVSHSHDQTPEDRQKVTENGDALIDLLREVNADPENPVLTTQQFMNMPSQTHAPSHFVSLTEGEELIGIGPLFALEDLIAIVEEELGHSVTKRTTLRPMMN